MDRSRIWSIVIGGDGFGARRAIATVREHREETSGVRPHMPEGSVLK